MHDGRRYLLIPGNPSPPSASAVPHQELFDVVAFELREPCQLGVVLAEEKAERDEAFIRPSTDERDSAAERART